MRKEFIILGVIIVVLLVYVLFRSSDKVHYKIPRLDPVKTEDIDRIEIKKSDQTIQLVKKENKWLIDPNGYPTDKGKVDRITGAISTLTLTDLVSKSKNYSRYDLTKEKAIQVKAYKTDEVVREFEIGKQAATYGHTFVKIKDNTNVYYARESFRNHFDVKVDDLRDKVVMKLDSNEITEVEIEKEGKTHLFAKKVKPIAPLAEDKDKKKTDEEKKQEVKPREPEEEISWMMPDGKMGKKSALDSLINQLTNLSCQEYIQDKTKEDFKEQAPIYTLKLKGSKDYIIKIFSKPEKKEDEKEEGSGGEKYPAISSENSYPFLLNSWKAEQIMKKPEDLIEEEKKKEEVKKK
ncbi:MAG: DUF4340 domain-containing protein [Candidatus Aminicenantes bacterium]|nr:DUF4340 domain-containing protein [Candidatus Aminicenantes bacterium]NIM84740.1 DUF4340 domain-containing protein [Candidatus Aminicenantes bacterium]NIN23295.1 DUF4340 domain-containing protein [Candidatus Aminicenantes bacterium]NIN46999.1 DUF4340 domain-containing protein [Candidatus Aminicenantes bacterium]NIN89921.1 DUF4340 domain-containing protein [Candidatus Aminicenantes bacterium]